MENNKYWIFNQWASGTMVDIEGPFDTIGEAILKAELDWRRLSRHDRKATDEFYVYAGTEDEVWKIVRDIKRDIQI